MNHPLKDEFIKEAKPVAEQSHDAEWVYGFAMKCIDGLLKQNELLRRSLQDKSGFIFTDGRGEDSLMKQVLEEAHRNGRCDDVHIFDFSAPPERGSAINLETGAVNKPNEMESAGASAVRVESMDINAKEGDKVVFAFPDSGMDKGMFAAQHLELGKIYTVDYVDIGGWQSEVYLKELPDKGFNSVHFIDAPMSHQ